MTGCVLVIGESVIDIVRRADGAVEEVVGGSPANVALGLARLGVRVRFHTALARDAHGERVGRHLTAAGVEVVVASWSLGATSTALAQIGADGAARYTFDVDWSLPTEPDPGGAAIIHVGSISAFLDPGALVVEQTVSTADQDTLITLDPNIRAALLPDRADAVARFQRLAALADIVKLSDEDAAWLYPGEREEVVVRRLLARGPRLVALTRGSSGALLASRGGNRLVSAPSVRVRDTVGAGDTFMAALIAQVVRGPSVLDELDPHALDAIGTFAVTAAAITVQRAGADVPTEGEVRQALAR
ncbi:carbohydrate kinase family protein [Microbacterium gilvum]|uniref:Carbohydrate kinase n=1 Tax=Microbacterium gilvum TaxID=1336204 RepID=A0ABP8ZUX2_9MICO